MKTRAIYTLLSFVVMLSFYGCGNSNKKNQGSEQELQYADTTHTSRNALDYEGTYTGTMPCADCAGIYTELTLKGDSYTLKTVYEGKEDKGKNEFVETGKYAWDTTGSIITLNESMHHQYRVGENLLFALDSIGNRITGDLAEMYILKKK